MKDPVVQEVRRARERIAAKHNYDLNAIIADAAKRQAQSGHRIVSFARKKKKTG
jgi:hypothetical protein